MSDTIRTEAGNLAQWTLTGAAKRLKPQFVRDIIVSVASWIAPTPTALTSSASITWDTAGEKVNNKTLALAHNATLSITNAVDGAEGLLRVVQTGGGFTLTLPSGTVVGATTGVNTTDTKVTLIAWTRHGSAFTFVLAQEA